jgi:hypothetical protein
MFFIHGGIHKFYGRNIVKYVFFDTCEFCFTHLYVYFET